MRSSRACMTALLIVGHVTCSIYHSMAMATGRPWCVFLIHLSSKLLPLGIFKLFSYNLWFAFLSQLLTIIPPKSKSKKSAAHETPKKSGKQTGRRKQVRPQLPSTHMGGLSPDEGEPSLMAVMNLLLDINTCLSTTN